MGLDISIDFNGFGGYGDISTMCTKDNIIIYEKLKEKYPNITKEIITHDVVNSKLVLFNESIDNAAGIKFFKRFLSSETEYNTYNGWAANIKYTLEESDLKIEDLDDSFYVLISDIFELDDLEFEISITNNDDYTRDYIVSYNNGDFSFENLGDPNYPIGECWHCGCSIDESIEDGTCEDCR